MKKLPKVEFSQGVCADGVAILKDGKPMTPEEILEELRQGHEAKQRALDYANIVNDKIVAEQSAWIEWQRGKGAEAAMMWIHNGLWGPGQIPDENELWSDNPQLWYNANKHDPFPVCICGNPSSQLWMGNGACCDEHMEQIRSNADKPDGTADCDRPANCSHPDCSAFQDPLRNGGWSCRAMADDACAAEKCCG